MAKLPWRQLKLAEWKYLASHYCRHGHSYLEHYSCLGVENPPDNPIVENIGFLDIEATGLKGNWDFMLCFCLKKLNGEILGRHLTKREILNHTFDKNLTKELIEAMYPFHRIVVYYGKDYRYDIPFIRTRAERWKLDFPEYRDKWVVDVYDLVKRKLCLHRNRLETACNLLDIPAKGHRLDPDIWQKAQAGDEKSLAWIFEHCKEDVISLEGAYLRLEKYVGKTRQSI